MYLICGRYERDVLLRSICETMIPKLVAEDIPLLQSLLLDVFPGAEFVPMLLEGLRAKINEVRNLYANASQFEFLFIPSPTRSVPRNTMSTNQTGWINYCNSSRFRTSIMV